MVIAAAYELDFAEAYEKIENRVSKYFNFRSVLMGRVNDVAAEKSIQQAYQWLRDFESQYLRLDAGFCHVLSGDEEIKNLADALAARCEAAILGELEGYKRAGRSGEFIRLKAEELVVSICEGAEVDPPDADRQSGLDLKEYTTAVVMRLCTAKWWRGKLRKLQARKLETAARELGLTNKSRGCYVSNATVERRRRQVIRNRELLEKMEAENQSGQVFTLAELSDKSTSNPVNRCNELLTRVRGFEEWAAQDGGNWVPMFYTLTAPSRFHSHSRNGHVYPNWAKAGKPTPREAMEWLSAVWVKVRSAFDREKIKFFGLRVTEPHHCGCPHFHILLWIPAVQVGRANELFWGYAIGQDGDLPPTGAVLKRRFTAKRIDPEKGSAVGYVVKYITKNVHGAKLNGEEFEAGAVQNAYRVEAWASTWGIRQFQQVGGASVTVWREVRRLNEFQTDCAEVEEIRRAADQSDWCSYTSLMGGAVLARKLRPLRAYLVRKRDDAGELVRNAYGELVRKIKGVEAFGFLEIKTRLFEWVVRPKAHGFEAAPAADLDLCQ